MDLASKIKTTKEEIGSLDEQIAAQRARITELNNLINLKKTKQAKLLELAQQEAELLAALAE